MPVTWIWVSGTPASCSTWRFAAHRSSSQCPPLRSPGSGPRKAGELGAGRGWPVTGYRSDRAAAGSAGSAVAGAAGVGAGGAGGRGVGADEGGGGGAEGLGYGVVDVGADLVAVGGHGGADARDHVGG